MTRYEPALLVNGKVVTGCNHGDAFGKLSENEQDDPRLLSGFYDGNCHKFVWDDRTVYLKSVLLVRHADAYEDRLTPLGRTQVQRAAAFLLPMHPEEYQWRCSPIPRCRETATLLGERLRVKHEVVDSLSPQCEGEDFCGRIKSLLDRLPQKSLLVSHADVIEAVIRIATGESALLPIPNCSLTLIQDGRAVHLAKGV